MPTVYVETSIISYLAARPAGSLVAQVRQQTTRDWWTTRRADFELVVSQVVLDEAAEGDASAAARRNGFLSGLPLVGVIRQAGCAPPIICTPDELIGR
jgi:hypothetical protein